MKTYLGCLKRVGGTNHDECRNVARSYLACRMERQVSCGASLVGAGATGSRRRTTHR